MIALNIFELLNEVKVSCDLLLPSYKQVEIAQKSPNGRASVVFEELLVSGNVEIGAARLLTPEYVKFLAWKGTY